MINEAHKNPDALPPKADGLTEADKNKFDRLIHSAIRQSKGHLGLSTRLYSNGISFIESLITVAVTAERERILKELKKIADDNSAIGLGISDSIGIQIIVKIQTILALCEKTVKGGGE